jgi:orotate phosphoribosyltransferase
MAQMTARMLLDIQAVHFNTTDLFTHSSGKQAPTYIDCRKLISYPRIRSTLMDFLACKVMRAAGLETFDTIAGGETAGIPFAAFMADRMALPMIYVRKKPKGHGRTAQIEGHLTKRQNVLLVEDLTTDGGSKIKFVDALRAAGAECAHTAVVFSYGIFADTDANLAKHGLTLHALCTWADIIAESRAKGDFDDATLADVETFLADPAAWRANRGLAV